MSNAATLREIAEQYFTPAQKHNLENYLEDPMDFELAQAFTLRVIDELSIAEKLPPAGSERNDSKDWLERTRNDARQKTLQPETVRRGNDRQARTLHSCTPLPLL